MIVIRMELWPRGDEEKKTLLGEARIANDGSGGRKVGNYSYSLSQRGGKRNWKRGKLKGFPRLQLLSWDLLFRVLRDAVQERNEETL